MQIPDINLLLYAYDEDARHHDAASTWLRAALSGDEPVGFAWSSIMGFVRIATNPRAYALPMAPMEAVDHVGGWLARRQSVVIDPGPRHLSILRELLDWVGTAGNLTSDAHLAAIAIERGATLMSFDNDFSRFAGLRWMMPAGGDA